MTDYDDLVLSGGPVLYWPLEETSGSVAVDASGNGNHGTYFGAPELGQAGPLACRIPEDRAPFFDGEGWASAADFVGIDPSPISGSGSMSWEVWIRPEIDTFTRPAFPYANIIQQRLPGTGSGTYPGMVRVFTNAIQGAIGEPEGFGLRLAEPVRANTSLEPILERLGCWSYVALTKAGNLWTLYLNGAVRTSTSLAHSVTSRQLSFGGDWTDVGRLTLEEQELWRGRMAKAAAYPRALTAEEVALRWGLGCIACRGGWSIGRVRIG